jgi:hypothetical protein
MWSMMPIFMLGQQNNTFWSAAPGRLKFRAIVLTIHASLHSQPLSGFLAGVA